MTGFVKGSYNKQEVDLHTGGREGETVLTLSERGERFVDVGSFLQSSSGRTRRVRSLRSS
jgi:hypothetical protein